MDVSLRRREFLAMMAALGTTAFAAQAPSEPKQRIDLHHHFGAPAWAKRHKDVGRQGWEYGDIWLGDVKLQPIFDELNRRRAVIYTHPTEASCCHSLLPNTQPGTVEWNTDTGRSIYSVLADGIQGRGMPSAASRYSKVTFIWSHAGGTLLGLVGRFGLGDPDQLANPPVNSRLAQLRTFYFDTAGSANPVTMQPLETLVGASQIVYGTDYPFGGTNGPANIVRNLQRCGFTAAELSGIERENALRILPKYRTEHVLSN